MKTNKMLRLASILLVAVMISTCAISGTFAKYVTSGQATDSARVAKFGVEITANGTTFATAYDDAINPTVESCNTDKLVAPGTTKSYAPVTIKGTPEVSVEVKFEATLDLNYWTLGDSSEYCPVYFTVNGETYGITGQTATALNHGYTSISELTAAVEGAINAYTKIYGPNQDLSDEGIVATPDITWTWDFSSGNDNDIKDTYLGDKAANGTAPEIILTVKTTVTQVD